MTESDFLFYFLATFIVLSSVCVIGMKNPIYSALSMAATMVALAFLFFSLEAYFIAAVQLAVYAGAVMVIFVMVLMIFDLKAEKNTFSKGLVTGFAKLLGIGFFLGFLSIVIPMSSDLLITSPSAMKAKEERLLYRAYQQKEKRQFQDNPSSSLHPQYLQDRSSSFPSRTLSTKNLAQKLFKVYFFAFELLGVLLLVVAVGAVVVSYKRKKKSNKESGIEYSS